jgi:hypothetical protein
MMNVRSRTDAAITRTMAICARCAEGPDRIVWRAWEQEEPGTAPVDTPRPPAAPANAGPAIVVRTPAGGEFAVPAVHDGHCPYISLDVAPDGGASASPAFRSRADLLGWQRAHGTRWGCQRILVDGQAARRWMAMERAMIDAHVNPAQNSRPASAGSASTSNPAGISMPVSQIPSLPVDAASAGPSAIGGRGRGTPAQ